MANAYRANPMTTWGNVVKATQQGGIND